MDYTGAIFSEDRKYRYVLWRCWKQNPKMLQYIGLNPSTANEKTNDATIKRLIRITKFNGFDGFYMTNLFGIISTKPEILVTHPDPIGDNDRYLKEISEKSLHTIFCWGAFKQAYPRANDVVKMFPNAGCIDMTMENKPKHQLFIAGETNLKYYNDFFSLIPSPV